MMAMPVLGSCDDARCRADPEPTGGKGVSLYVLRRSRLWLFGHASCPLRWLLRVSQSPLASMPILARSRASHHRGNNAGAAIIGGLIGLGVGAAIASGGYYAPPPPVYYGAPPGYYGY